MNPTNPLDERGRAALLDRLFRRISQLDDATLWQLDALTSSGDVVLPPEAEPHDFTRRGFLLTLLLAGTGAVMGGGAAAMLLSQPARPQAEEPAVVGVPGGAVEPTVIPSATPDRLAYAQTTITQLEARLTEVNSERLALRAQLDTARSDITNLTQNVNTLNTSLIQREGELGTTQQALEQAQADVDYMQRLLDIYGELEAVGLDETLGTGIQTFALALLALEDGRNLVESGVQQATLLLQSVETQTPTIANGLLWLENQITALSDALRSLEDALGEPLDPVRPVAEQFGGFVGDVIDALPFGMGQPLREVVDAAANLIGYVPDLVESTNPTLVTPLRQWVTPESDQPDTLVAEVVEPIRSTLIAPTQDFSGETTGLESSYESTLAAPVAQALAARAAIRERLAAAQAEAQG